LVGSKDKKTGDQTDTISTGFLIRGDFAFRLFCSPKKRNSSTSRYIRKPYKSTLKPKILPKARSCRPQKNVIFQYCWKTCSLTIRDNSHTLIFMVYFVVVFGSYW